MEIKKRAENFENVNLTVFWWELEEDERVKTEISALSECTRLCLGCFNSTFV